ncbi:MAG: ThiF family adenylyltransferase, partial [Desulfurococcaceae archaeon]
FNPNVRIRGYSRRADEELLDQLVHEADLVIDGLDNWKTRFMLNRICVKHRKPLIHAGVYGVYGQLLVVVPGITPCLQCVMVKEPPERGPLPVLGTTPGLLAMIQVTEAIKILTGYGEPALNRLIVYNGYTMEFREVTISRNPNCPVCGGLS